MIDSAELEKIIADYKADCLLHNERPTRLKLALKIKCSTKTISNVLKGFYGLSRPYTDTPMATRIINNKDFELLRALFKA